MFDNDFFHTSISLKFGFAKDCNFPGYLSLSKTVFFSMLPFDLDKWMLEAIQTKEATGENQMHS